MKIGIFFGGPSREREVSFAGGRTVFDNLDKSLFTPIPYFVDSQKRLIELDWPYLYKGTIRDFYPSSEVLPHQELSVQLYIESLDHLDEEAIDNMILSVGKRVEWTDLSSQIDLAFLALHGEFGEDGQIQGLMESMNIPYTGSGILACAIGMDKAVQKKLMVKGGFSCPEIISIKRQDWVNNQGGDLYERSTSAIGWPMVIRPANQGSSIGVTILDEDRSYDAFKKSIDKAFFIEDLDLNQWRQMDRESRSVYIRQLSDIRSGLGYPLLCEGNTIFNPDQLMSFISNAAESGQGKLRLEAFNKEQTVIVESFIKGKEFSCIVIRSDNGEAIALPPTEIVKGGELFDYRSKYLPGLSRKETPIRLPNESIEAIRSECCRLFDYLAFNCYARIDGFIQEDGTIYLNDPNTTSGMMPSSFFFHQAAEIGLNPSQFLTFIIRSSLMERSQTMISGFAYNYMLDKLDAQIIQNRKQGHVAKKKVGVILGGFSFERHISMESGRNIYEKLASSSVYEPIPVFLTGSQEQHLLYHIPVNLLLKDNADDIRDKILNGEKHEVIESIKSESKAIINKYASMDVIFEAKQISYRDLAEMCDIVFVALHGRPGEDGAVQSAFEEVGLPYTGSGVTSSQTTIDKYKTLQTLKSNGFKVAHQLLILRNEYLSMDEGARMDYLSALDYPCIVKPVDDGCSSAVKLMRTPEGMRDYLEALFRDDFHLPEHTRKALGLSWNEEFPMKDVALLEELIMKGDAEHFLEITGGMLTHYKEDGELAYEVFEPSETLAVGEVLTLEEKFLAGEGQNITPARYDKDPERSKAISTKVRQDLERVARLLKVEGYCRIDAFVRVYKDDSVETIVIEVNSLPGMTPATCIFHQCALNDYQPYEFIHQILEFGEQRFKQQKSLANQPNGE